MNRFINVPRKMRGFGWLFVAVCISIAHTTTAAYGASDQPSQPSQPSPPPKKSDPPPEKSGSGDRGTSGDKKGD